MLNEEIYKNEVTFKALMKEAGVGLSSDFEFHHDIFQRKVVQARPQNLRLQVLWPKHRRRRKNDNINNST